MSEKFQKTLKKSQEVIQLFRDKSVDCLKYAKSDFSIELTRPTQRVNNIPCDKPNKQPVIDTVYQVKSKHVGLFKFGPVKVGEAVSVGDIIGYVISMKIKHPIKTKQRGILKNFLVTENDRVDYGAVVAVVE